MGLRIFIADDHGLLRAGLRSMLKNEQGMEVVGEAADGAETVTLCAHLKPDIVLADISMPGLTGIEVAQQLSRTLPGTRVLILTMHEDAGLLQEALQAGASGYLIKRAAEADLIHAIQTVARGEIYVHEDMQQMAPSNAWPRPVVPTDAVQAPLSDLEREVLSLVARGYTNRQVSDALHLEQATVESTSADLAARLGVRGRVGLIQYAKQHGII